MAHGPWAALRWYYASMRQSRHDPVFEQLRADIQEGVAAAERGDVIDAEVVWREYGLMGTIGSPTADPTASSDPKP